MPKQEPREQVQQIPLSEIHPFRNHPFKVLDDELMQQTIDSIMQVGILNPAIIRPDPEGGYEMVTEFGVDIVKDRRVQNLYHVASRHFEAPEVKLLIDAVQSARFITHRKSRALVNRLSSFVAPGDTSLLKRQLYIDSRSKATNESIYLNVDRIQTAITERKKISFCYFDYSPSKERVLRHRGQVYSPWRVSCRPTTAFCGGWTSSRSRAICPPWPSGITASRYTGA